MTWRTKPPAGIDCPVTDMETVWITLVGEPIRVEGPDPACPANYAEIPTYVFCSEFCMWRCQKDRMDDIREGKR